MARSRMRRNAGEAGTQKGSENLAGGEAAEMGRGQIYRASCTQFYTFQNVFIGSRLSRFNQRRFRTHLHKRNRRHLEEFPALCIPLFQQLTLPERSVCARSQAGTGVRRGRMARLALGFGGHRARRLPCPSLSFQGTLLIRDAICLLPTLFRLHMNQHGILRQRPGLNLISATHYQCDLLVLTEPH